MIRHHNPEESELVDPRGEKQKEAEDTKEIIHKVTEEVEEMNIEDDVEMPFIDTTRDPRYIMSLDFTPEYLRKGFTDEQIFNLIWNLWWDVSADVRVEEFIPILYGAAEALEPKKYSDLEEYQQDITTVVVYVDNRRDISPQEAIGWGKSRIKNYLTHYDWSSRTNFASLREKLNKEPHEYDPGNATKPLTDETILNYDQIVCRNAVHTVIYDSDDERSTVRIKGKTMAVMEESEDSECPEI